MPIQTYERLRELNDPPPKPAALPTDARLREVEETLGVQLPPSYREYQLHYSDVCVGFYEPFDLLGDGDYLDLVANARQAWETLGVPRHLLPFVDVNGDYYCFDTSSPGPEYRVVYWSHDGLFRGQVLGSFAEWVEQVWISETLEAAEE